MEELKLKVNDVCKVIANNSFHGFTICEEVTITKLYPDENPPHYRCDSTTDFWFLNEKMLFWGGKIPGKRLERLFSTWRKKSMW